MSFSSNLHRLFTEIDLVSQVYIGWSLADIKEMSPRERKFWVAVITWRKEASG